METFGFLIQTFEFDEDLEDHGLVVSGRLKNNIVYWELIDVS